MQQDGERKRYARMRDRLAREQWNLGFIHQPAADVVQRGIRVPVRWLPRDGRWCMFADPSCRLRRDGSMLIFAEHLDYWIGRGEIWASTLGAGEDPMATRFTPWLRGNKHLSFPFPLTDDDGTRFVAAESWESGRLLLWRVGRRGPELVGGLIDRPVVDPAFWHTPEGWWCFCTMQNDLPNERLYLFHSVRLTGPWIPHLTNPVKCDLASARPAGPLFIANGQLIRPAQDCSRTYGGAVMLNLVTRLDHGQFAERPLRRLTPLPEYPDGLHSFCPAGEWTIIDGKRWELQPLDLLRKLSTGVQARRRRRSAAAFESCAEALSDAW